MNTSRILLAATVAVSGLAFVGCSETPETPSEKQAMQSESQAALNRMYQKDPSLRDLVQQSYGYAIFPNASKAGLIAGGAGGQGEVYEQGRLIGYADLAQGTVGAQIGAQNFDELLVFQDEPALRRFQSNQFSPTANATAVMVKSGAGAATRFENGTAVLVLPVSGAMAEASVGGQKFTFHPVAGSNTNP